MDNYIQKLLEVQDTLLKYAISLTGDIEEANDLLQETLLRMLTNYESYKEEGHFRQWSMRIMKNNFINMVKKNEKYNSEFIDGYDYGNNEEIHPLAADNESIYMVNEIMERIKRLPPKHAEMMTRRINGYKYEEIAKEMNISVGYVKSSIFIARDNLRNLLNN